MLTKKLLMLFILNAAGVFGDSDFTFKNISMSCWFQSGNVEEQYATILLTTNSLIEGCSPGFRHNVHVTVESPVKSMIRGSIDIPHLIELNMTDVGLEEIRPGTFDNLPKLETLILKNNKLRELKARTFVISNVNSLQLQNNEISEIEPETFQNLLNLDDLNLGENKLKEIKKGVFQNLKVWKLILEKNEISKIEPGAFEDIHSRQLRGHSLELRLSNNKIEEIDQGVFNNTQIDSIDLSHNSISVLHPSDFPKYSLESLFLSNNKIKEVPAGVFDDGFLKILKLDHNQISVIADGAFKDLRPDTVIHLEHNHLTKWSGNWFTGSSNISVFLSHNQIVTLPSKSFKNALEDSAIELDHNKISQISEDTFEGLSKLRYLNLSHNEIKEWKKKCLEGVKISEFVDLSGNTISCPESGANSLVTSARRVVLDNCSEGGN